MKTRPIPKAPPMRRVVASLAFCGVGVVTPLTATAAAAADNAYTGETYCGTVYSGASPAEDPFAAFNDMANAFYDDLWQNAGGPSELCGPYHWLIEQGAQMIVDKHVPDVISYGLDAVDAANNSAMTQTAPPSTTPAIIPAVGPSVTYRVSWTNGLGLWLRGGPGGNSSLISVMPEGSQVQILCQARGEVIAGPYATTDLWDKVVYTGPDGVTTVAMASDAYIDTLTNGQVAPTC